MEEKQMNYNLFLEEVRAAVQENLGSDYEIRIQKITKNNGVVLEGLIIGRVNKIVAPTIYLNSYYMHFTHGMSLQEILDDIISQYKEITNVTFGGVKELLDFNNLKDKVVFKLIQREKNQDLLNEVPFFEFQDLEVVLYLLLDENNGGQITALIHNAHMKSWGIEKEELYCLAKKNTPILLAPEIKTMKDVMRDFLKKDFEELGVDEMLDELLELESERPALYVLSNRKKINGAACILYDKFLRNFAILQNTDIIILPTSVHETILVPDKGNLDYRELQNMVEQINISEVPEEDILSNRIYKYSLQDDRIRLIK